MKKIVNITLILLIALSLIGCSSKPESGKTETPESDQYKTIESKDISSFYHDGKVTKSEYADYYYLSDYMDPEYHQAVSIYNSFAADFFKEVYSKEGNQIFSPLSLYSALALLSNGADGETKNILESALGMSTNDLNLFLRDLNLLGINNFKMANCLWFNSGFGVELKDSFVDKINAYYSSGIHQSDFSLNTDELVKEINDWAEDMTDGAIKDIMKKEDIDDDSAFYLLNALACGSRWILPFDSSITFISGFNDIDGSASPAQMMHKQLDGFWQLDNCSGIAYDAETVSLVALLPNEGIDIDDFVDSLSGDIFRKLRESHIVYENWVENAGTNQYGPYDSADRHFTILSLPKFEYTQEYSLKDAAKEFGLGNIFDANKANLSNMGDGPLFVKNIKQNDKVLLNEERIEAAAVTVIDGGMGAGFGNVEFNDIYHYVNFNRPFVYAIMKENIILFMGVVNGFEDDDSLIPLEVLAEGKIKVRSGPSKSAEQLKMSPEKGCVVYENDRLFAYEKKENDGYTWYRIGDNAWIADQNGEWIKEAK